MINRTTKLRWRRVIRRRKRQVEEISSSTEQNFERHLIRRLVRLPQVRRFVFGWIGLMTVLSIGVVLQTRALDETYKTVQPKPGGIYNEGVIGSFSNANPLFSSNSVDSSVSRLIFAGLLKYNSQNQLVNDMAEQMTVDPTEKIYTVKLRSDVQWHDGKPVTAQDVAFTYKMIQNPDTKSYLYPSWQNIRVEAVDNRTVVFTLPNSFSSFAHSLTNGIIPEHVLGSVKPIQMRSNTFNNVTPIGSGPFTFSDVEVVGQTAENRQERIAAKAFDRYHGGKPKLDAINIRTYTNEKALVKAYEDKQINAMAGLESMPDSLKNKSENQEYNVPLTGQVLVFFRTSQDVLKDVTVRKALVLAADKKQILNQVPYPLNAIDEPLLKSHTGYNKAFQQVTNNPEEAKRVLDQAGWMADPTTGMRSKDGVKLSFRLYSQATAEYASVTGTLQKQWRAVGADVQVELQPDQDLQSTLAVHSYDALLYGISVGSDPDVFAFWHSSQTDPRSTTRLNFSEYRSNEADLALAAGRTRSDAQLRSVKYQPFLEAWRKDAPALALYQPRFLYVARSPFAGFNPDEANTAADRFANVENWTIREGLQTK